MDSDPLPPVELIELDEPAAEPARVQMGGGPNRRRWLALALVVVVALVVVAIVQGGADDTSESSPTSLDPSIDQGPFSENLVPFERKATSTTVTLPPVVPNAVGTSLVIERGGDIDVVDLATGVRRDLAVIADAAGVVAVRGGLIQADGDATLHPIGGAQPVTLGAADVVRRTEREDMVWLVRQPDDGAGSATLVDANGTVLASPLEIPANAEVTGATTRWLLLSAYDRTYVLGLDGVLRPAELPEEVTPTGSDTVVFVGCDDSARCGPRVLDLPAATSRPLGEPDAIPTDRDRFIAEPGGERVAVAAADYNVVVIGPDGISVAIPGAVRDPAWLPDDLGLLALSDTGQLLHWTPDGQVRMLDLTVDDASHIFVVTG